MSNCSKKKRDEDRSDKKCTSKVCGKKCKVDSKTIKDEAQDKDKS